jgi:hypothetical protein
LRSQNDNRDSPDQIGRFSISSEPHGMASHPGTAGLLTCLSEWRRVSAVYQLVMSESVDRIAFDLRRYPIVASMIRSPETLGVIRLGSRQIESLRKFLKLCPKGCQFVRQSEPLLSGWCFDELDSYAVEVHISVTRGCRSAPNCLVER